MSISDELETLSALKDKGDLSPEEFEKAKAKLLSEDAVAPSSVASNAPPPVPKPDKKKATQKDVNLRLVCAIMTTLAAVLNGVGMSINPNPLKAFAFVLFIVASVFWWISYAKGQAELRS